MKKSVSKPLVSSSIKDPVYPAWENVVLKNKPPKTEVKPEVLRSWHKSKEMGLDPFSNEPPAQLSGDEFKKIFHDNQVLIERAKPVMHMIEILVKGTGFIVTLADKHGHVLIVLGHNDKILEMAKRNYYLPGCRRDIEHAGTNAIGLCLEEDKPIQLTGCEHFRVKHHDWTCSSAPIHCLERCNVIGAITLSGQSTGRHTHTLALVSAAAEIIEAELREHEFMAKIQNLNSMLSSIFNSMSHGVIAVDCNLNVTHLNQQALKMLGLDKELIIKKNFVEALEPDEIMRAALDTNTFVTGLEVNFSCSHLNCTYICKIDPVRNASGDEIGRLITLTEKQVMLNLAKKLGGNYAKYVFEGIKGSNPALKKQIELARITAKTHSRVLISAESGTGKELFAQAIHNHSPRRQGPFMAICCATIPRDLVEAELFGYRPGAFTGARRDGMTGKFEIANQGTLFLDEIDALPLEIQAKLLRVLQENEITRLGDNRPIPVDVRLICATNRDLFEAVQNHEFREDLYFRINVVEIVIPPLRERIDDLQILINHFFQRLCSDMCVQQPEISEEVIQIFRDYHWPGNVRELENCLERALLLSQGQTVLPSHLPQRMFGEQVCVEKSASTLRKSYKEIIEAAIKRTEGNMSQAARELKIARSTLYRKMKEFDIPRVD